MKKIFLFLFVATFVLFTSCEKDAEPEPEPYSLAADLQNGYWEDKYEWTVLKFDGTNITDHYTGGWNMDLGVQCIAEKYMQPYTLEGNTITLTASGATSSIKIEDDVLTIDNTITFQRKETLGYSDC